MDLLIRNIGQLIQIQDPGVRMVAGEAMSRLNLIHDAWLSVDNGRISGFGPMSRAPQPADQEIDASGCVVMPGFCDPHTHLVYAGSREQEFVDRIRGLSYEEIARRGGGILNSAKRLRSTTEDELFRDASLRLREIASQGTAAVEIKSGYGLDTESELKMLRVIRRLKDTSAITIKSTFLGAHAVPPEFRNDQDGYVSCIIEEMLPAVAASRLADYVDVFCDEGFFTTGNTARILEAAAAFGLRPKIHANELACSGGIQIGVQHRALSVDHLEWTGQAEIDALKGSDTMPTLLPGAALFLGLKSPPARLMISSGLPVALGSDFNPGSSPAGNMMLMMALACIRLKMLPEEAIQAATINAAYAMGVEDELGSITIGKRASLIITKPVPGYAYLPYAYGSNLIGQMLLNGQLIEIQ
jgi:imidazolonepropionase